MASYDPRAELLTLSEERGDSLASLSRMLGRNVTYLQQFITKGSPRKLDERDRRLLADYFGIADERLGGPDGTRADRGLRVPRLDVAASAGPGAFVDDEVVTGADVIDPVLAKRLGLVEGQAGIIRVRGNSMEPGLVEGDLIVVDLANRDPGARGGIAVIRVDGTVMVKRVFRTRSGFVATSDNPDAPAVDGAVDVIGRVVWLMREPR